MKSQLRFKISEQVKELLKKKNQSSISITVSISGGGCCPTIETLDISLGEPKNKESYDKYEDEEINIYISTNAKIIAPVLKIDLKKTLLKNKIEVSGLSLKTHNM